MIYSGLIIFTFICVINSENTCSSLDISPRVSSIKEGLAVGTIVRTFSEFNLINDINTVTIQIPNDAYFKFDIEKKQLLTNSVFDAETNSEYSITLNVKCNTGESKSHNYLVVVNNINDEKPTWMYPIGLNTYSGQITDNLPVSSSVTFQSDNYPKFIDKDKTKTPNYRIQIFDSNKTTDFMGEFEKDTKTSEFKIIIKNQETLDYDRNPKYDLILILEDLDSNNEVKFAINTSLTIKIIDRDSKPPVFEENSYNCSISADAKISSEFQVKPRPIKAVDGDKALNVNIKYKLLSNLEYAHLDPETGKLWTTASPLPVGSNGFKVEAYQANDFSKKAAVDIQITIYKSNDVTVKFQNSVLNVQKKENEYGEITTLKLSTYENVIFTMNPIYEELEILYNGVVMVKKPFDYEYKNLYIVNVAATNGISNDTSTLNIKVIDVIEYPVNFTKSFYKFEAQINDACVGQVEVIKVTGQKYTFTLTTFNDLFSVNESTGEICRKLKNVSPYIGREFILTVMAKNSAVDSILSAVSVYLTFRSNSTISRYSTSTTSIPAVIKEGMLPIFILVPILILLIIIFPIVLCYYKKRRVYKTSREPISDSKAECRTSTIPYLSESFNPYENCSNLHNVPSSERHVSQLQDQGTSSPIYATINKVKEKQ